MQSLALSVVVISTGIGALTMSKTIRLSRVGPAWLVLRVGWNCVTPNFAVRFGAALLIAERQDARWASISHLGQLRSQIDCALRPFRPGRGIY